MEVISKFISDIGKFFFFFASVEGRVINSSKSTRTQAWDPISCREYPVLPIQPLLILASTGAVGVFSRLSTSRRCRLSRFGSAADDEKERGEDSKWDYP